MGDRVHPPTGHLADDRRELAIAILRRAVTDGRLSLTAFEAAVDVVMRSQREAELAMLVRELAPPVRITPPERQHADVVELTTSGPFADIKQTGRWQVPRWLVVRTGASKITLDLTDAEFDDWEIDIEARTTLGDVVLVVPRGTAVQLVRTKGPVRSALDPPAPGYPLIRLTVELEGIGTIRLRHPKVRRRDRR